MGLLDKARQAAQEARDKAQAKYSELEEEGRIDEWKSRAKQAIDQGERTVNNMLSGDGARAQSQPPPAPPGQAPSSPPPATPPPSAPPPPATATSSGSQPPPEPADAEGDPTP